jgi:hypothetical protein
MDINRLEGGDIMENEKEGKEKYYVVRLLKFDGRYYNVYKYRFRSPENARKELKRCQKVVQSCTKFDDCKCTLSVYDCEIIAGDKDKIMDDDKDIDWSSLIGQE